MIYSVDFFESFRNNIIAAPGILYADWTASGRAYRPIETYLQKNILPFVGNTHTHSSLNGSLMSEAYTAARRIIKQHVHAGNDDVLILCGSGMTAAVNKLQRILGIRIPERMGEYLEYDHFHFNESVRPVVFITHMEHHSNQLSWLETIATVEIFTSLKHFAELLFKYKDRKNKIAAITACSNVTGIQTAYHEIARMIHAYEGYCFVDFACSAPYVNINMHPLQKDCHLDAIYFSPHKFLGGPGTPGVLVFNRKIYKNAVPDHPGGGTVLYSNPWEGRAYIEDIEQREDGGTPPFLQAIKAGMTIRLKEQMGVDNMLEREALIVPMILEKLSAVKDIEILSGETIKRMAIISFIVKGAHYNLVVKILNDRFGIQARGGCSCAGTYGHFLLKVEKNRSDEILQSIRNGNLQAKPGWVRLSFHPVMSDEEIAFILEAVELTAVHFKEWAIDYFYDGKQNEYQHKTINHCAAGRV
ncbi:MAG: aminotransferase class V-fold PLP-dependent enzyme, partial [Bacteroidota bacterium]